MANITVTYTFTNSTTADATEVNTNFTDIINGTSDGSKDFSINALTCAGTLTANGAVTLGNASSDDITITGSLASSIPIKTTNTYDIGSASLGLAGVYFGTGDTDTARVVSASLAADVTYTMPDAGASANFVMSEGAATINGAKTFGGLVKLASVTLDSSLTGYDVSGVNIINFSLSANRNINTLAGGVAGQILYMFKTGSSNTLQIVHASASAGQKIYSPKATNVAIVNGAYGGFTLMCDGTQWVVVSDPN